MFTYKQTTGQLFMDEFCLAHGYSGHGDGKNNPAMQDIRGVGPLPCGTYTFVLITDDDGNAIDYEGKKAPVFRLVPDADNVMYDRDGFLLHGDSVSAPGTASEGCIVEDHDARVAVLCAVRDGNNRLEVVQ